MPAKTRNTRPAPAPAAPCPPIKGEYNGRPTITLRRSADDKFPFSFGVAKAKLIIQHIGAIREFAETASES